MRKFACHHQWNKNRLEKWEGCISEIRKQGDYCEFTIESRSSIHVFVGSSKSGWFACIPEWRASCWLSEPSDLFFNKSKLANAMKNVVDGVTVAFAIKELADILA